nr:PREDICTED: uncharacterized protein LOC108217001 [Daucus carota subsp. sativus]
MISVYELCSDKSRYGGHTLKLKQDDDDVGEDANCIGCEKSIIGSPTYICSVSHDDLDCRGFYLHKSCAELSIRDDYHGHPLRLIEEEDDIKGGDSACFVCNKQIVAGFLTYTCIHDVDVDCQNFYLHKTCTEFPLQLNHHKHSKHSLAFLPAPNCFCDVCFHVVKFAYKCDDYDIDDEPDLVQFPLPSKESLLDLIITQYDKFQVDHQGEGTERFFTLSTRLYNPLIIYEHWSHPQHQLEKLHYTACEDDDDDSDDDAAVLICDGCIQPITLSHPSYYACIQCGYFLHSFCATKLPTELPAGASSFHPQHSLMLWKRISTVFSLVICGACNSPTNGFFYHCKTCDIIVDIRCAFLPTRIKHISHKHALVQRPFSEPMCSISKITITGGLVYGCETCSDVHISILCAFLPSVIKHRFDSHPITLRLPPFFYEGVFYCEMCEEQVNNQWALYHCDKSDHSFHYDCFDLLYNVKFGGTIELDIDHKSHIFTFVLERPKKKGFLYKCRNCADSYESGLFFRCDGCGYLACYECVIKVLGESSPSEFVIPT